MIVQLRLRLKPKNPYLTRPCWADTRYREGGKWSQVVLLNYSDSTTFNQGRGGSPCGDREGFRSVAQQARETRRDIEEQQTASETVK